MTLSIKNTVLVPITFAFVSCQYIAEKSYKNYQDKKKKEECLMLQKKYNNGKEEEIMVNGTDTFILKKDYYTDINILSDISTYNKYGYKDGWDIEFYRNGYLKRELKYYGNRLIEAGNAYTIYGDKLYLGDIKRGTGKFYIFDELGNLNFIYNYTEGLKHGDYYRKDENVTETGRYDIDKFEGKHYRFYKGKLNEFLFYSNDKRVYGFGFHENKSVKYYEFYDSLEKATGPYVEFYPNKKYRMICNYEKGIKNGPYKSFFANGQLYQTGAYLNGDLVGETITYNNKGQLVRKVKSKND